MMTAGTPLVPASPPTCPRCGYDQRGTVATWGDHCPLSGRCSECGLDFAWDDLLGARAREPAWSFEHQPTARRLVGTWARSLRPWSFWKRMRMEDRISPWRAGVVLIAAALVAHLSIGLIVAWRVYLMLTGPAWTGSGLRPSNLRTLAGNPLDAETIEALWMIAWPHGSRLPGGSWYAPTYGTDGVTLLMLAWVAAVPLGFVTLRHTMRATRVRWVHLWRVWCYAFIGWMLITVGFTYAAWVLGVELSVRQEFAWYPGPARYWASAAVSGTARGLATGAWLMLFWGFAVRRYLRLPHAWGVVAAMVLLAFLIMLGAMLPLMWHSIGRWLG